MAGIEIVRWPYAMKGVANGVISIIEYCIIRTR